MKKPGKAWRGREALLEAKDKDEGTIEKQRRPQNLLEEREIRVTKPCHVKNLLEEREIGPPEF